MTSLSICPSHQMSVHHTFLMISPSVCQSTQMSDCHTIDMASPSVCQTYNSYVCHSLIQTSLSICQLHDSSVCQPKCDSTWNSVWKAVCPSSVLSVLPSAKFMVKTPMSSPIQKFPYMQHPGKLPTIHTSMDSSVNPPGSLSITLSPSDESL